MKSLFTDETAEKLNIFAPVYSAFQSRVSVYTSLNRMLVYYNIFELFRQLLRSGSI